MTMYRCELKDKRIVFFTEPQYRDWRGSHIVTVQGFSCLEGGGWKDIQTGEVCAFLEGHAPSEKRA